MRVGEGRNCCKMCWTGISDTGKGGKDWDCSTLVGPLALFAVLAHPSCGKNSSCGAAVIKAC